MKRGALRQQELRDAETHPVSPNTCVQKLRAQGTCMHLPLMNTRHVGHSMKKCCCRWLQSSCSRTQESGRVSPPAWASLATDDNEYQRTPPTGAHTRRREPDCLPFVAMASENRETGMFRNISAGVIKLDKPPTASTSCQQL